jgi:hypothetical protein
MCSYKPKLLSALALGIGLALYAPFSLSAPRSAVKLQQPAENNQYSGLAVTSKLGKTSISFKTYVDASYIDSRAGGVKNSSSGFGANVKRFYLTIDHNFNDIFSARFRPDIEQIGGDTNHPHVYNVYIKNAFVAATLDPALTIRVGVADLPWVPYVEDLYGYRYVEHVLADRAHFATSADLGVHVLGKFGDGLFDYQLSVVNGGGYHNIQRTKTVDVSGRLGFHPTKQIIVAVGAREGKLGAESYPKTATTPRNAYRYDAVAAWVSDAFRFGLEGFWAKNYAGSIVTGAAPADKAWGVSGWFSYALPFNNKFALFGRYDYVKPHRETNSGMHDQYANIGVQYHPVGPLQLSLVYKFDKIAQGSGTTGYNATNIKASGKPNQNAYYNEIGFFAQYAF